jgi:hypothetical protein
MDQWKKRLLVAERRLEFSKAVGYGFTHPSLFIFKLRRRFCMNLLLDNERGHQVI